MKIIGIDTSTGYLALGGYDGKNTYDCTIVCKTEMSRMVTVVLSRFLFELGWRLDDIDYIAFGKGPGSFTGMRIGAATVKGLAYPHNKPIIAFSTLDIIARNIQPSVAESCSNVIVALDAKRGLIYTSSYRFENNQWKKIKGDCLVNPSQLKQMIKKKSVITGDALKLYAEELRSLDTHPVLADSDMWWPRGHQVIAVALESLTGKKIKTGYAFNAKTLIPLYLYPDSCQVRGKKGK